MQHRLGLGALEQQGQPALVVDRPGPACDRVEVGRFEAAPAEGRRLAQLATVLGQAQQGGLVEARQVAEQDGLGEDEVVVGSAGVAHAGLLRQVSPGSRHLRAPT